MELSINIIALDVILTDETKENRLPLASVSFKELFCAIYRPLKRIKNDGRNLSIHISCRHLMAENQMFYRYSSFEFPVLFSIEQNLKTFSGSKTLAEEVLFYEKYNPFVISVIFNQSGNWIRDLSVKCPTASIFVEDVFAIRLSGIISSYQSILINDVPRDVSMTSLSDSDINFNVEVENLRSTIFIEKFSVSEVNILVSAKANLKLYLGADSSSIKLAQYSIKGWVSFDLKF